jgi:hypothetical protein
LVEAQFVLVAVALRLKRVLVLVSSSEEAVMGLLREVAEEMAIHLVVVEEMLLDSVRDLLAVLLVALALLLPLVVNTPVSRAVVHLPLPAVASPSSSDHALTQEELVLEELGCRFEAGVASTV